MGLGIPYDIQKFPELAVEDALAPSAREAILSWWEETNPQLRGAQVADVLDMLSESDSYIRVTEAYWERGGEALADRLFEGMGTPLNVCEMAAVILFGLQGDGFGVEDVPPEFDQLVETLAQAIVDGEVATVENPR